MPRKTTIFPFAKILYLDAVPKVPDVDQRFCRFLSAVRKKALRTTAELDESREHDRYGRHDLLKDTDLTRINRRAVRYVERVSASTEMSHLEAKG